MAGGTGASPVPSLPSERPLSIFRPEALEHHSGDRLRGEPLRLGGRWGRRSPVGLLGVAAVAAAAGMTVPVDERASGPWRGASDGRSLAAVLPAAAGQPLVERGWLDLDLPGGRRLAVRVSSRDVRPIGPDAAVRSFGRAGLAALLPTSTALVIVEGHAQVPLAVVEGGAGRASVTLRCEPLLPMLLSGLLDRAPAG